MKYWKLQVHAVSVCAVHESVHNQTKQETKRQRETMKKKRDKDTQRNIERERERKYNSSAVILQCLAYCSDWDDDGAKIKELHHHHQHNKKVPSLCAFAACLFVCRSQKRPNPRPLGPSPTTTQPTPPAIRTSWNPSRDKCLACCAQASKFKDDEVLSVIVWRRELW